jgi:hypothetical protein
MSEEKKVVDAEFQEEPKEKQLTISDLKAGYIVGITEEGNFVFELVGQKKGLVELLGMHSHASAKVKAFYDRSQTTGDALVAEVGKGLAVLNKKLDQLLGVMAPKKPDNNIE